MNRAHPGSPPAGDGWRLRAYRAGDERWIVRQFGSVFGRQITEEFWRWKLKTLPSPVENVWLAVDGDDRPIFQYAAIPRRLHLPDGAVHALVLVDLWTAPEYRRRKIFTTCARWIHDHWRDGGVAGVLSPFNARHEPRYQRLGWQYLFPLRWQIRPLHPEAIASRRLKIRGLERWRWVGDAWNQAWDLGARAAPGVEIGEIATADSAALAHPRPARIRCALEHGADWVHWRYLTCPHHHYTVLTARHEGRPAGHLAYRIEESGGRCFAFVAELVGASSDIERALIAAATTSCLDHGAVAVATLAIPGTDLGRAWRRRGYLFSWGQFCVHWLPLASDPSVTQLRDPRAWEMVGGDYDVI